LARSVRAMASQFFSHRSSVFQEYRCFGLWKSLPYRVDATTAYRRAHIGVTFRFFEGLGMSACAEAQTRHVHADN